MTAISHHNRKDLMIEARFLPESLEDAKKLRQLIYEAVSAGEVDGVAASQAEAYADQVVGWLVGKTDGVDRKGPNTRSKYRRILTHLEDRHGGKMREPGIAGVLAATSATMGVAIASGNPAAIAAAGAAMVLAPIIYEAPVSEVVDLAAERERRRDQRRSLAAAV